MSRLGLSLSSSTQQRLHQNIFTTSFNLFRFGICFEQNKNQKEEWRYGFGITGCFFYALLVASIFLYNSQGHNIDFVKNQCCKTTFNIGFSQNWCWNPVAVHILVHFQHQFLLQSIACFNIRSKSMLNVFFNRC